jgi:hypothetical protein
MAVTFISTPQDWSPSDNPLTFVFSSNQTSNANFTYKVQTFVDGVQVAEDTVFLERSTRSHYDASSVVKDFIQVPTRSNTLYSEANYSNEVYIKVIENYGTTPTDHANASSTPINVFKACLSDKAWKSYISTDYVGLKYLTNIPRNERIYQLGIQSSPFYLNIITDGASSELIINVFDSSGTLLDFYSETQSYLISQINLSPELLIDAGLDLTGASYYTVQVEASEMLRIDLLLDYCYSPNTLQWPNEFGAYDSFIFEHNLEQSGEVKDQTYGKQFGQWNGTSFEYDINSAGTLRVGTKQKDKGVIYTSYITQSKQRWLCELYKSPRHYLIDTEGTVDSIKITTNQFSFQQDRFEELISESVAFEYTNGHNGISL